MIRDNDAAELADLKAAYELLEGIGSPKSKGKKGKERLPTRAYMKDGSSEDIEARKAITRLLRNGNPLDSLIRHSLADLFDPTPYEYETRSGGSVAQRRYPTRRLVFKGLPGRKREDLQRLKLAEDVREIIFRSNAKQKKISVEEAVAQVVDKYGVSEKTVWDAWGQFELSRMHCNQTS
jgi:hypothetical protein